MTKYPALAFILSAVPGLGHVYAMGLTGPAAIRIITFLGILSVALLSTLFLIGLVLVPLVWLWIGLDAAGMAKIINDNGGALPEDYKPMFSKK